MDKVTFVMPSTNLRLAHRAIECLQESCGDRLDSIVLVLRPEIGFTMAVEQGWRAAMSEMVCFLNDDAYLTADNLEKMIQTLQADESAGAVGPTIPCRSPQGMVPPTSEPQIVQVPYLVGACLLTKRHVLAEIDGWDTGYTLFASDIDLSFRIHDAGYKLLWARHAWVNHFVGASVERQANENVRAASKADHARLAVQFPGRLERAALYPVEPVLLRGGLNYYEWAKAHVPRGARVADLGCGCGRGSQTVTGWSAYHGWDVERMPNGSYHPAMALHLGPIDAQSLLMPGEFDVVLCLEVLEHCQDPGAAAHNAWQLLKPGGVALFSVPLPGRVWNPYHLHEFDRDTVVALLDKHFAEIQIDDDGHSWRAVARKPKEVNDG